MPDETSSLAHSLAGVMNLVQMSRSLSDFLSSPGIYEHPSQLQALGEQNTPFSARNHAPLYIMGRREMCGTSGTGERSGTGVVCFVCPVYLVYLVCLVCLVGRTG